MGLERGPPSLVRTSNCFIWEVGNRVKKVHIKRYEVHDANHAIPHIRHLLADSLIWSSSLDSQEPLSHRFIVLIYLFIYLINDEITHIHIFTNLNIVFLIQYFIAIKNSKNSLKNWISFSMEYWHYGISRTSKDIMYKFSITM